jgi:hypothetical protein
VVGRNQSVYEKEPTKGSKRLVALVGKRHAMTKELVEINQYKMGGDSELETMKDMIAQPTFKRTSNSRLKWHSMIDSFCVAYLLLNKWRLL